ncbi:MAG: methyltransferase domain-containing protein [Candidatus Heimdallarchaeota archaeon]|nr:methyltransferase domain-containing protein [Candidatus Heimdallarchaeota archaeon]
MMHKKNIADRYDSSATIYDKRYSDIQKQKYQEIIHRINFLNKSIVLDVGCGTGSFLKLLDNLATAKLKTKIGIDLSFEMIKEAHKKFPEGDFIVADSDSLPLRDNVIDLVVSITHLQNLPDPTPTIEEIVRTSKDRAQILISVLRKKWSQERLQQLMKKHNFTIIDSWEAKIEDIGVLCTYRKKD